MPLRRYRDVSEMEEVRHEPGTRALYETIRHVWGLSDRIFPLRFPSGVFKHRSIEDAERLREQWEHENFVAYRRHLEAIRRR